MRKPQAVMTGGVRGCAGFTLIEVLIAVSLLSLLTMLLMGGVRFGVRVMDSETRRVDRTMQLSAALGFLRERLEQAQPLGLPVDEKGNAPVVFVGEPDKLTFVGVTPPYLAIGGYELVTIHVDRRDGQERLVATWHPYRRTALREGNQQPSARRETAGRDTVLFGDAVAVEFNYFGSAAGEPSHWQPEWRDRPTLPALVRIRVTLRDGDPTPELVVALRLDGDAS